MVCLLVSSLPSSSFDSFLHSTGAATKGGTIWEGDSQARASSSDSDTVRVHMKESLVVQYLFPFSLEWLVP